MPDNCSRDKKLKQDKCDEHNTNMAKPKQDEMPDWIVSFKADILLLLNQK